jgi:hypothetical protein
MNDPMQGCLKSSQTPRVSIGGTSHHNDKEKLLVVSDIENQEVELKVRLSPDFHCPDISSDHFDETNPKEISMGSIDHRVTRSMVKKGVIFLKSRDMESIVTKLNKKPMVQSE